MTEWIGFPSPPTVRRIAALFLAVTLAACATDGTDGDASAGTVGASGVDTTVATGQEDDPADATVPEDAATDAARCAPADGTAEPITLNVWHGLDGDVIPFFEDVIATFESEHPGIAVELTRFDGGYTDGIEQLAAVTTDDRPDVFMGSNASVRLQYDSGLFVPPSECTGGETPDALTDLLPIIERTYTVDGTLVAAPYNVSTPVMMYDRRLWRAAGVDPDDPPVTFDELETVVRRLRDSGAAATGMVLYDRAASWLVEQAAAQEGRLLVVPSNGRDGTNATDVTFATPEAIATLERFRVLHRDGYLIWVGINRSGRDDLLALVNPEAPSGLALHTSAAIGDAVRIIDSGIIGAGVEFGAAALPGNAPGGLAGGGAWWLLARDDPARVAAAWTLVDWLVQPDRVAELAAFTGYVPTTERAATSPITLESWQEIPALRVGYDQLAAMPATDAAAGLQVGPMVELQRSLEVATSATIDADQDPAEQLRAAEGTARTALATYASIYGTDD